MKSIIEVVVPDDEPYKYKRYSPVKENLKWYFERYGMLTLLVAVLFSGMVFGAAKAGTVSHEFLNKIAALFADYLDMKKVQTPIRVFVNSFSISFVFMALIYFLSLSPLGIFLIPAVMFFRGFEYGMISGFLCVTYSLKGLAYYIAVILCGAFISSSALMYLSQYCIDFSVSMLFLIFGRGTSGDTALKSRLGEMSINCAFMIIFIIFASLIDTVLYYIIGGLFNF